MADRVQLKKLNVRLMRQPGEGVPVGVLSGRKRPLHVLPRQALEYVIVIGDVTFVVQINEAVMGDAIVKSQGEQNQRETQNGAALLP